MYLIVIFKIIIQLRQRKKKLMLLNFSIVLFHDVADNKIHTEAVKN